MHADLPGWLSVRSLCSSLPIGKEEVEQAAGLKPALLPSINVHDQRDALQLDVTIILGLACWVYRVERVTGCAPASSPWKGVILLLNYTRVSRQ